MSTLNSGISIYPSGFDLNISGSTMTYVYDETRDPFTGNVTSSGSQIIGVQVNTSYTAIDNIERTLGLNPQGSFDTVADRILDFESVSGSQAFVQKIGDTMTGDLNLISGAALSVAQIISASGVNWSGAGAFILNHEGPVTLSTISTVITSSGAATINTGDVLTIKGGSGLSTTMTVSSGNVTFYQNVLPSGLIDIGASDNPIDVLYVNSLSGNIAAIIQASGVYLPLSGGVLSGNTTFSGASILTALSGTGSIGSLSEPFADVYAKTGYFTNVSGMSPINILSEIVVSSGITPTSSGTLNLGTSDFPFAATNVDTLNTNVVIISGQTFSPSALIQSSGGTVTGSLTFVSGASIGNAVSGVNSLAAEDYPFSNIWTKAINGNSSVRFKFNELLNPVSPSGYEFTSAPSGATVIDTVTVGSITGIARYLVPATDYTISGTLLTVSTGFSPSGALYSPFYIY